MLFIQPRLDKLTSKKQDICHIKNLKLTYTLLFPIMCRHLTWAITTSFLIFGLDTIVEHQEFMCGAAILYTNHLYADFQGAVCIVFAILFFFSSVMFLLIIFLLNIALWL